MAVRVAKPPTMQGLNPADNAPPSNGLLADPKGKEAEDETGEKEQSEEEKLEEAKRLLFQYINHKGLRVRLPFRIVGKSGLMKTKSDGFVVKFVLTDYEEIYNAPFFANADEYEFAKFYYEWLLYGESRTMVTNVHLVPNARSNFDGNCTSSMTYLLKAPSENVEEENKEITEVKPKKLQKMFRVPQFFKAKNLCEAPLIRSITDLNNLTMSSDPNAHIMVSLVACRVLKKLVRNPTDRAPDEIMVGDKDGNWITVKTWRNSSLEGDVFSFASLLDVDSVYCLHWLTFKINPMASAHGGATLTTNSNTAYIPFAADVRPEELAEAKIDRIPESEEIPEWKKYVYQPAGASQSAAMLQNPNASQMPRKAAMAPEMTFAEAYNEVNSVVHGPNANKTSYYKTVRIRNATFQGSFLTPGNYGFGYRCTYPMCGKDGCRKKVTKDSTQRDVCMLHGVVNTNAHAYLLPLSFTDRSDSYGTVITAFDSTATTFTVRSKENREDCILAAEAKVLLDNMQMNNNFDNSVFDTVLFPLLDDIKNTKWNLLCRVECDLYRDGGAVKYNLEEALPEPGGRFLVSGGLAASYNPHILSVWQESEKRRLGIPNASTSSTSSTSSSSNDPNKRSRFQSSAPSDQISSSSVAFEPLTDE